MKKFIITLAVAFLGILSLNAQKLPDVKLYDVKGKAVSSKSLLDSENPIVVTFWASWCKPCQKELAAITDIYPDWEGDFPLKIYAICVDDSRSIAQAKALARGSDWPVTVLYDTNLEFAKALNVSAIPHVFVFNSKGVCKYNHNSYIPGDEEILFEKVLNAK